MPKSGDLIGLAIDDVIHLLRFWVGSEGPDKEFAELVLRLIKEPESRYTKMNRKQR